MGSFKLSRKCTEYVFSNQKVLSLLDDIKDWFDANPASAQKIEASLESMVIEYDHKDNLYIASVFIADN